MLCANSIPRANDASLEQRECGFDGIGMNVAFNVDVLFVADRLVPSSMHSRSHHCFGISGKFVRHNHIHGIGRDVLSDVLSESSALHILSMEESEFASGICRGVTLPDANNDFLSPASSRATARATLATANIGFILFR